VYDDLSMLMKSSLESTSSFLTSSPCKKAKVFWSTTFIIFRSKKTSSCL
jgi:hypothetical protein